MGKERDDYLVQPVMKALLVLDYVVRQGRAVSLTETVQELGLPKTTVFRYLQTLSAVSYIEHDVIRDRYCVGGRFRELASTDRSVQGLREFAQPEMQHLHEAFGETVNLAVLSKDHVVYLDVLESRRPARPQARVGHRHPLHSTSLGKAMLAFLPAPDAALLGSCALEAVTMRTLTDADRLRREVDATRQRGYAIEIGENEDGQMCIGVPILDAAGYPVAALSLSGPERRMLPGLTASAASALKTAAQRISAHLGG